MKEIELFGFFKQLVKHIIAKVKNIKLVKKVEKYMFINLMEISLKQ